MDTFPASNHNGSMSFLVSLAAYRGPMLIGLGLALIGLAPFWPASPQVTAIALVAWGALSTLHARPRTSSQDALTMVNLTIYCSLVCLAIVAQSHAVMKQGVESVSAAMIFDHAAAIVLLLGLAGNVVQRLSEPLAEEN